MSDMVIIRGAGAMGDYPSWKGPTNSPVTMSRPFPREVVNIRLYPFSHCRRPQSNHNHPAAPSIMHQSTLDELRTLDGMIMFGSRFILKGRGLLNSPLSNTRSQTSRLGGLGPEGLSMLSLAREEGLIDRRNNNPVPPMEARRKCTPA